MWWIFIIIFVCIMILGYILSEKGKAFNSEFFAIGLFLGVVFGVYIAFSGDFVPIGNNGDGKIIEKVETDSCVTKVKQNNNALRN